MAINPAGLVLVLITPECNELSEAAALMVYPADRHQLTELVPAVNDPHWVFFSQLRIVKNWRLTEL